MKPNYNSTSSLIDYFQQDELAKDSSKIINNFCLQLIKEPVQAFKTFKMNPWLKEFFYQLCKENVEFRTKLIDKLYSLDPHSLEYRVLESMEKQSYIDNKLKIMNVQGLHDIFYGELSSEKLFHTNTNKIDSPKTLCAGSPSFTYDSEYSEA
ncbi:MAG: hypothetical protein K0Q51_1394 [Rickettsiaceae bacterium]|jgi:hypothetical protein|nr:hypothetical protein [Rickettsiaceae bacterium]